MSCGVQVAASIPSRDFSVDVHLQEGRVTAVVGPNGSGKTTLVHLVCGLLRPDPGQVRIGDTFVADASTFIQPHRRTVALLEQRSLLFPHLDVLDNVAFGVRARGATRTAARQRASAELAAVGAEALASRHPEALSGGEAQRVSLARALAIDPTVVLLDEPFASLDVTTAASLRRLLTTRLSGTTVAMVTHDPLDVWALASDLICMEAGRVSASGPVAELLARPRTGFLAQLSGVNLLHGTTQHATLHTGSDQITGIWESEPAISGHLALATFHPSAVALFTSPPHGSPRNTWNVRVAGMDSHGATVRMFLTMDDGQPLSADLTAQGVAALDMRPGDRVVAQVKATQITLYPR